MKKLNVEAKNLNKEEDIKNILRDHINGIESLEVMGRNLLITLKRGIKRVNADLREILFQLIRDAVIGGFRVVNNDQVKLINNWKIAIGVKKREAILKECNASDAKPGRSWCIYKHNDDGSIKKKQGKGWPKTYKTKKDGEKALGIMKVFSSSNSGSDINVQSKEDLVEEVIEKLLNMRDPKRVDEIFKKLKIDFSEIESLSEEQLRNILDN